MAGVREIAKSVRDMRLPKEQRAAAKAERVEQARTRRNSKYKESRPVEERRAKADFERQRYSGGPGL